MALLKSIYEFLVIYRHIPKLKRLPGKAESLAVVPPLLVLSRGQIERACRHLISESAN
jgi:hypothetical protein